MPNPIFSLTPAATVDEGNNWVNISWGPLSLVNPVTGATLGNYPLAGGSPAIDAGTDQGAPKTDFFGNARPQGSEFDIGAVEFVKPPGADLDTSPQALAFGTVGIGRTSSTQFVTLTQHWQRQSEPRQHKSERSGTDVHGTVLTRNGVWSQPELPDHQHVYVAAWQQLPRLRELPTHGHGGWPNGTLTINSNDQSPDAATDKVVSLSGTGVKLLVSPSSLNFLTFGGGTSGPQTVTVTNTGPGNIQGLSFSVSGVTNGVTFTAASGPGNTGCTLNTVLAPSQSCTIRVTFRSPTAFTAGIGTLTVNDNEPASVTVTLNGTRLF